VSKLIKISRIQNGYLHGKIGDTLLGDKINNNKYITYGSEPTKYTLILMMC
jgi:hypothetical protein